MTVDDVAVSEVEKCEGVMNKSFRKGLGFAMLSKYCSVGQKRNFGVTNEGGGVQMC